MWLLLLLLLLLVVVVLFYCYWVLMSVLCSTLGLIFPSWLQTYLSLDLISMVSYMFYMLVLMCMYIIMVTLLITWPNPHPAVYETVLWIYGL